MTMRHLWFTALPILALSAGCSANFDFQGDNLPARRTLNAKVTSPESPEIMVDFPQGSISVSPGEGRDVVVVLETRGVSDAALAKINVDTKVEGKVVKIQWSTSDSVYNNLSVSAKVTVPKDSALNLKTGAGAISAENFSKGLTALTGAGSIKVVDVTGKLSLESSAGEIQAKGANGQVRADSSAGAVHLSGTFSGDCLAQSGAGEVVVRLSTDSQVKVDASTGAGSAENGFGWPIQGTVNRSTGGTVGDGSKGTLKVHTGAGAIRVEKGN